MDPAQQHSMEALFWKQANARRNVNEAEEACKVAQKELSEAAAALQSALLEYTKPSKKA